MKWNLELVLLSKELSSIITVNTRTVSTSMQNQTNGTEKPYHISMEEAHSS